MKKKWLNIPVTYIFKSLNIRSIFCGIREKVTRSRRENCTNDQRKFFNYTKLRDPNLDM